MDLVIQAISLDGQGRNVRLLELPDICPRCHRSVHAKVMHVAQLVERKLTQTVFRCTHLKCQELFLGSYRVVGGEGTNELQCQLFSLTPIQARTSSFPESVSSLSPAFVEIYDQSMAAEASGLTQLVGIGLRKALEFLVKDYAVSEHSGQEEAIRKTMLAPCIETYVADPNVKACAKLATWLGNDETHYTRRWLDKDIEDLKRLVRLTVNWIENATLTKKYVSEMNATKP